MSAETTFDCIPEEVMGDILEYLDSTERQRLRRISILWNTNITNLYGAALKIDNSNLEETLGCSYTRIIAHLQNLTLSIPMTETGTYFMNRLTSLSLTGMIVCYNIYPVFENCLHIRELALIGFYLNPALKQYEVNTEDPSKLLPQLRALTIKFPSRPFDVAEFKFLKTLLPFFKPLNSDIGKLDKIVLESAGTGGPLEISFNKIFEKNCFIMPDRRTPFNNSPSQPIGIEIADQFYSELVQANRNTLRYLELADGEFGTRISMRNFSKPEVKCSEIQISEFDQTLMSGSRENYSRFKIVMFPFLSVQTHLTTLSIILSNGLTLEDVYTVADGSATTLKSLSIRYEYQETLNATSISQLNNLRTLKFEPIFTSQFHIWDMFKEAQTRIININHLPPSLRVLITFGSLEFFNDGDFNEAFFINLRNLEVLKIHAMPFFHFPNNKTYVMEPFKIRQLIAWFPKLKELVLRNCRPKVEVRYNSNQTWTTSTIDALPNESTNWISMATFISFQKIPFINPDPGIPDEISELFDTGPLPPEANWHPLNRGIAMYDFPVHFDGVILIEPEFREKYEISE